ncbi:MAG: ribose-phosphate diphosphokinase [Gemmatimonadaceae bacterium]
MNHTTSNVLLLAGTGNPSLAALVAAELGQPLGACTVRRFPDGEIAVELAESVRSRHVVLLQPTAPPVNDHLVELLALADACRRADAARVIAVVPYVGYARGDKRERRRVPVMARLVADLLEIAGVDHLLAVDVHTQQLEGFFRIPVDVLTAVPLLCDAVRGSLAPNTAVVSPDLGAVRLATEYGRRLDLPVAVCRKRRLDGATVEVSQVIGDVHARPCLIVDDMITTGNTVVEAVRALQAAGADQAITVAATHGVLTAGAADRLFDAGVTGVVVTDSVPLPPESARRGVRAVSVAPLLAAALHRLQSDHSLRDVTPAATAAPTVPGTPRQAERAARTTEPLPFGI